MRFGFSCGAFFLLFFCQFFCGFFVESVASEYNGDQIILYYLF
jgi:hypothetical protein